MEISLSTNAIDSPENSQGLYWEPDFKDDSTSEDLVEPSMPWIKLEDFDDSNQNLTAFSDILLSSEPKISELELPFVKLEFISDPSDSVKQIEVTRSSPPLSNGDVTQSFVFVCQNCYFIFKTVKEAERHSRMYHGGQSKFNRQCLKVQDFKSESNLTCSECHVTFKSIHSLLKHHLTHKTFTKCVACDISCTCHAKLKEHFIIHHNTNKKFACYACEKTFKLERYARVHMRKKHPIQATGKFPCPICEFVALTTVILDAHLSTHIPNSNKSLKKFQCLKCSIQFRSRQMLVAHMLKCFRE